ncbi:hypothetical protein TBLA_0A00340 [Henningerozyma blattae CBS 6284]|uniref:Nascent polypeptide-associated complex subunit beta n=1 Tax=Henningerozyma blattae (strain ATCC 34711 / CBS 6284 / DSM 70876 / NBRC 10599 / NRRL Y-10934 / UCD 77-7) TaxID=1071380 RepID=I2GUN2_HENB6|nr:hypothetical protein TBLA_0A00340 [Tetrapisispora blattae CBS 6284]CCH57834.1 hypothetical protein TBLA_0A00340 [Tetrapisispora blattae CBS 6284]
MPIDQEKLAKLQKMSANNKVGGRRKFTKKPSSSSSSNKDDTKLVAEMAKMNAVTVDNVAEANFFKDDGNVIHFNRVGVQTAEKFNTSVFYGAPQTKPLQQMFPQILSQMGPEALQALTQLASQLEKNDAAKKAGSEEKADEAIPELVEGKTFDADVE